MFFDMLNHNCFNEDLTVKQGSTAVIFAGRIHSLASCPHDHVIKSRTRYSVTCWNDEVALCAGIDYG